MSTTDIKAAFEALLEEYKTVLSSAYCQCDYNEELVAKTESAIANLAATEAAKATGTAGEQSTLIGMEVSMDVSTGDEDFDHRIFGRIEGLMAKGDGTDIILAVEESRNFATDTQAARQPAPVVSSDLRNAAQLIMDLYDDMRMGKESIPAFDALRAALAATAAPVLSGKPKEGEKGWRPACCDGGGEGSPCCDFGGCAANNELAEMREEANRSQP